MTHVEGMILLHLSAAAHKTALPGWEDEAWDFTRKRPTAVQLLQQGRQPHCYARDSVAHYEAQHRD